MAGAQRSVVGSGLKRGAAAFAGVLAVNAEPVAARAAGPLVSSDGAAPQPVLTAQSDNTTRLGVILKVNVARMVFDPGFHHNGRAGRGAFASTRL
jgi:hypothetical protein